LELLVADLSGGRVLRFSPAGSFRGVFAEITYPFAIATDGAGLVYVASYDGMNGTIREYDESGNLIDILPTEGLFAPLAVGPDGRVYAADFNGDRVLCADFGLMPPASCGEFVTPGSGGLNGPTGLTFGPDGHLYVSSRISGQVIRYDGATGEPIGVFATPGGNGPQGLAFGPDGDLFVANDDTDTVLRFDGQTGSAAGVFVTPASPSGDGMKPVFGPDGRLYVSTIDLLERTIERFDAETGASQGVIIRTGDGGLESMVDFVVVPEPRAAAATILVWRALRALSARRSARACTARPGRDRFDRGSDHATGCALLRTPR